MLVPQIPLGLRLVVVVSWILGYLREVALVTGRSRLARRGPPLRVTLRHLERKATLVWCVPVIVRVFKSSANVQALADSCHTATDLTDYLALYEMVLMSCLDWVLDL